MGPPINFCGYLINPHNPQMIRHRHIALTHHVPMHRPLRIGGTLPALNAPMPQRALISSRMLITFSAAADCKAANRSSVNSPGGRRSRSKTTVLEARPKQSVDRLGGGLDHQAHVVRGVRQLEQCAAGVSGFFRVHNAQELGGTDGSNGAIAVFSERLLSTYFCRLLTAGILLRPTYHPS